MKKIHDSIEELPSRLPDARDCVRTNYNTSGSAALTMVPEPAEGPKKTSLLRNCFNVSQECFKRFYCSATRRKIIGTGVKALPTIVWYCW